MSCRASRVSSLPTLSNIRHSTPFRFLPIFFALGLRDVFFNTGSILWFKHGAHIIFFNSFLIVRISRFVGTCDTSKTSCLLGPAIIHERYESTLIPLGPVGHSPWLEQAPSARDPFRFPTLIQFVSDCTYQDVWVGAVHQCTNADNTSGRLCHAQQIPYGRSSKTTIFRTESGFQGYSTGHLSFYL